MFFLLNNCCAVLENLSPSVADLHEYAAMRLVSVTVLVMKKHAKLVLAASKKSNSSNTAPGQGQERADSHNIDDDDEVGSDPLTMHSEVARALLGIIKHGLSETNIEGNVHLIYALIYHQGDLMKIFENTYRLCNKNISKKKQYSSKQTARIKRVIIKASGLVQEEGARSAPKVLKVLEREMLQLKKVAIAADLEIINKIPSRRKQNKNNRSYDYDVANSSNGNNSYNGGNDDNDNDMGNSNASMSYNTATNEEFTFSYEEEADPEVFFVPYIWDIIVSVVTASTMEWKKDDIEVFPLLDEVDEQVLSAEQSSTGVDGPVPTGDFSQNADEMV